MNPLRAFFEALAERWDAQQPPDRQEVLRRLLGPFGLHDLRLAVEVAREVGASGQTPLPVGVVVNRDGVGDRGVDDYCAAAGVPILMRIPHDRRIAEAYSDGVPLVEARPEYRGRFVELWKQLALWA